MRTGSPRRRVRAYERPTSVRRRGRARHPGAPCRRDPGGHRRAPYPPRRRLRRRRPHPVRQGRREGRVRPARRRPGASVHARSCCAATPSCPRSGSRRSRSPRPPQIGDQGLTLGRPPRLLAGLPKTTPGYSVDRMCAGAMTAVTNVASSIGFGAIDVAIAGGVEHMGRHPMGEGIDPEPPDHRRAHRRRVGARDGQDRREPPRPLPAPHQGALRRVRRGQPGASYAAAYAAGKVQPDLVPVATRHVEKGWGLATVDEPPRPGTTLWRRSPA